MQRTILALATLLVCSAAAAHDFWLEVRDPHARVNDVVGVRLLVGDGFPGESYARNPRHLERFVVIDPSGSRDIAGRAGENPAGSFRARRPGLHVIAYGSSPTRIELDGDTFQRYLEEVGLEEIAEGRIRSGQATVPGREAYARCAKTILKVGAAAAAGFDRPAGLSLELVPERDPLALAPGDALPLRALLNGEPASGLLLRISRRGAREVVRVRTDAAGRASVSVDRAGLWMVSGVHMSPAVPGAQVDWESLWTSLTFVVDRGPAP